MGVFNPIIKKIIKWFMIAIIIIFSLYGIIVIWYANAYDSDKSSGLEWVTNGNETVIFDYTFTLENYVLWTSVLDISVQYGKLNLLTGSFEEIYLDSDIYRSHNFTLHEVSTLIYFGEKIIGGPYKHTYKIPHNYSSFSFRVDDIVAPPFTKVVTKVKISYEFNHDVPVSFDLTSKPHWRSFEYINAMSLFDKQYPFNILFPIFLFVLSGFGYASLKKCILSEVIDSFNYIRALTKQHNSDKAKLESELRILVHHPNLIDDGPYVFLTPTTTLFKMFVRRKITRRYHQCKILGLKSDADLLLKFLKDEHTKPSSTLLEFRVIALIVGLLASIGFTLTWNVPAIRPILMAIGLWILCFNFGFLIYVFCESKWELYTVSVLVGIIILVMIFERGQWNLTKIFLGTSRFIEEFLSSS